MKSYLQQLVLLIFLAFVTANAAELPLLQSISVKGNHYFSTQKIIGWSGLKRNKPVSDELLTNAAMSILNEYSRAGFYFSRIDSVIQEFSTDSSLVAVTIFLTEGDRLVFGGTHIIGDTLSFEEDFLPLARSGRPFYPSYLASDFRDLVRIEEEGGHPFARIDLKDISLKSDTLGVTARLTAGPKATLDQVRIIGLRSTKPNVIARETRIVPGETYSKSRVLNARDRIRKLPFIESVSVPALVPKGSNQYDLLFQVEESRSNSFDGVVGYQPGAEGEEGVVTGLLDLSFLNLFGTGRKARIHWERATENQQALMLYYEEPWIFGLPVNLWGEFSQEILDSLYLERYMAAGATWPALDVLSLRGSVFQEEVLPDSAGEMAGIYKSTERGAAIEVEYDTRDYIDNPIHGIYYRSRAAASIKDYVATGNTENVDIRHYESDVSWTHPVIGRQIVNLQVHGRFLQSGENPIPQPDLYRLGGAQTLRGYREDQFLGYLVGWGAVEYRLWIDKVSRIYAFYNLGYYEWDPPSGTGTERKWPWGYGVGFRQGTRIGIIGFDFALGQDDVLSTAKVHFRIINRF